MTTRVPLTEAEKQDIGQRKQEGASLKQIALELNCSPETTRKWWRYLRKGSRPQGRGRPRHGVLSTYPAAVREKAVELKRSHPRWGPANVKLELEKQLKLKAEELPSEARLSALFKAECPDAVQPRQRRQYPERAPPFARHPHQRWQVDEKEAVLMDHGQRANILNIRDPQGALMIASRAFETTTQKGWRKLDLSEIQDTLRQAFTAWGVPLEVQTDHGKVFAGDSQHSFPTLFTLWLVGLGIQHILSRSGRPTDQPHVERSHRTMGDMAWRDQHLEHTAHLQSLLDQYLPRHNLELPSQAADCGGRPPLEVRPWARFSGRPFHPDLEWQLFDMQRVDAYLAQQVWTRPVAGNGTVTIGRHKYNVGTVHKGQRVSVRFIPESRSFHFVASDGSWRVERSAVGLDQADIIGRMPSEASMPLAFQLPLPLEGV